MPPVSAVVELAAFEAIRAEAKARGYGLDVAYGVFERRMGYPCPFAPAAALTPATSAGVPAPALSSDTTSVSLSAGPTPTAVPVIADSTGKSSPSTVAFLDFESRSACDLTECGSAVYAEDPSTEILCMAWRIGVDGETGLWTPADGGCPERLAVHIAAGGLVEAHNAAFEQDLWQHVAVARLGWPAIPEAQWRDSYATCAAFAIPESLDKAGAAMNCPVRKDPDGRRIMLKLSQPRRPSKHNPAVWHEDPEEYAKLYAYCRQDVAAEVALGRMLPPLSAAEQAVWQCSNRINRRGIACDRDAVRGALRMLELGEADYHRQVGEVTGGALSGDDLGSWQRVLPWCQARGYELPNYQKGTLQERIDDPEMPEDVRAVLRIRLALGKASTAKYRAMLNRCSSDGRIRNTLAYHGAAPGRWAGRGIQPQNFPRGDWKPGVVDACLADMTRGMGLDDFRALWGDPFAAASNCLRGCLVSEAGRDLIAADYSAIEARVANWLSGQADIVQVFRDYDAGRGPDAYKVMAAKTYRIDVALVDAMQRQLGKAQELGCQYGLGWKTFKATAAKAPYVIDLTDEQAQAAVNAYRESHPQVKRMWYTLEAAALSAVRTPGTVTSARAIRFRMLDGHLRCRLPSGRLNTYPFAKVEPRMTPWGEEKDAVTYMGENPETKQWERLGSYGGFWLENCTQAVARDLMASAMLRIEDRGWSPVLSCHDELLSEVPKTSPISPEQYAAVMCELPAWAEGLPVAAAGWRGKRYRK